VEQRSLSRLTSVILLAVGQLSGNSRALAQTSPAATRAKAEALNSQAAIEMNEGRYASACPKFAEVVELVPSGIGAKMSLAACYERWGRLASAWGAYQLTEQAAVNAHDPRAKEAHDHAVELAAKAARLTLVVPEEVGALPELEITLDGKKMESAAWNKPMLIDKGPHVLRVTATGKQAWTRDIEIDLDGNRVRIPVAKLRDIAPMKPAPPSSQSRPIGMADA
jgi:hypothetical protein